MKNPDEGSTWSLDHLKGGLYPYKSINYVFSRIYNFIMYNVTFSGCKRPENPLQIVIFLSILIFFLFCFYFFFRLYGVIYFYFVGVF